MIFHSTGTANLGELNVRVNFGRQPHNLTEERLRQMEEDVTEIVTAVQLEFLGKPIDANAIHTARNAIGNALLEKYGDYYPRVVVSLPHTV